MCNGFADFLLAARSRIVAAQPCSDHNYSQASTVQAPGQSIQFNGKFSLVYLTTLILMGITGQGEFELTQVE